jgi:hypothetical protein
VTSLLFLTIAILVGAMATFAALLPYGAVIALMVTPFGGSAACLLAGVTRHALLSARKAHGS